MGTWVNLFQASVRLASTGNMRGTPSPGNASRMATRTAPVRTALRRKGSRNTARPESSGTRVRNAPMQAADTFLKKSRRFGWVGVSVACIKSPATSPPPPPLLRTNHKRIPSKGKVELDDIVRFNTRKERWICSLKRDSKANGRAGDRTRRPVPSRSGFPGLNFSACFSNQEFLGSQDDPLDRRIGPHGDDR